MSEDRTQRDLASRLNLHSLNLLPMVEDPAGARDGDIWYRQDLGQYRIKDADGIRLLFDMGASLGAVLNSDGIPPLTGAEFKRVSASNMPTGANDLYIVPVGRRAMVHSISWYNPTGTNILAIRNVKISGTYHRIGNSGPDAVITANGVGPLSITSNSSAYIFEAGESMAVITNNPGLNTWFNVLEYDASVPVFSAKIFAPVVGNNVLYSVPEGKSARLLDNIFEPYARDTSRAFLFTNSTGVTVSVILYLVPDGGSVGVGTQLAGVINLPTNFILNSRPSPISLISKDEFIVNVNSASPGQFFWINVVEI